MKSYRSFMEFVSNPANLPAINAHIVLLLDDKSFRKYVVSSMESGLPLNDIDLAVCYMLALRERASIKKWAREVAKTNKNIKQTAYT